jgi:transcriptional regulator with XRE-family HTH domain
MPPKRKTNIELYVINKVKEFRMRQNISQADLAFQLDVTNGFVGQVETPTHPAKYNLNHLNKLAEILGCSIKDFLPDKPIF